MTNAKAVDRQTSSSARSISSTKSSEVPSAFRISGCKDTVHLLLEEKHAEYLSRKEAMEIPKIGVIVFSKTITRNKEGLKTSESSLFIPGVKVFRDSSGVSRLIHI